MIISIDGPAGSGKSTIAKELANRLGFSHLNSGRLYRWVAYNVIQQGINADDANNIEQKAINLSFDNIPDINLNNEEVSKMVPMVAKLAEVRKSVLNQQRNFAMGRDIVAEGRDIGSVVFPNAELKIFLSATPEERANRRLQEYLDAGKTATFAQVLEEINNRDLQDTMREHSPLVKPADAIEINTTNMSIEQVLQEIQKLADSRKTMVV